MFFGRGGLGARDCVGRVRSCVRSLFVTDVAGELGGGTRLEVSAKRVAMWLDAMLVIGPMEPTRPIWSDVGYTITRCALYRLCALVL